MGNDMTWEQKCRISALRAACASSYDLRYKQEIGETLINSESDEDVTKRILARAETFRNALLHNGRLDDVDSFIEILPESPPSLLNEQVYIGTCKHCLTAIQLFNPFNDKTARWIDAHGYSKCANQQVREHEPELEEPIGAEPLGTHCPECGASSREMPLQLEDKSLCRNQWHQDWCNCQAIPGSFNYPGPWHKRADEPHYPCAMLESNVCPGCGSSSKKVRKVVASMPSAPDLYCRGPWHEL